MSVTTEFPIEKIHEADGATEIKEEAAPTEQAAERQIEATAASAPISIEVDRADEIALGAVTCRPNELAKPEVSASCPAPSQPQVPGRAVQGGEGSAPTPSTKYESTPKPKPSEQIVRQTKAAASAGATAVGKAVEQVEPITEEVEESRLAAPKKELDTVKATAHPKSQFKQHQAELVPTTAKIAPPQERPKQPAMRPPETAMVVSRESEEDQVIREATSAERETTNEERAEQPPKLQAGGRGGEEIPPNEPSFESDEGGDDEGEKPVLPEEYAKILERDRELIDTWKEQGPGADAAGAKLAYNYSRLVYAEATRACSRTPTADVPFEDVVQRGYEVLFNMAKKWDSSRKILFFQLAGQAIHNELKIMVKMHGNQVHMTQAGAERLLDLRMENYHRAQRGLPPMTDHEASEYLDTPMEPYINKLTMPEIRRLEALTAGMGALDFTGRYHAGDPLDVSPERRHQDRGGEWHITNLTNPNEPESPEAETVNKIMLGEAIRAYVALGQDRNEKERRREELKILALRSGAFDEPMTQLEVARLYGVSKSTIQNWLNKYFPEFREWLKDQSEG